jgi:hypothetical protein
MNILSDTNGVLQVVIPPLQNRNQFKIGVIFAAYGAVAILGLEFALQLSLTHRVQRPPRPEVIHAVQALCVLAVGYTLAVLFTGKRLLTLTTTTLQIQYVLLGLTVSRKSFENSEIKDIRYEQWQVQSRSGAVEQRGIRFEAGSKTYSFGNSMTEAEAHELIGRMRQIYNFSGVEVG